MATAELPVTVQPETSPVQAPVEAVVPETKAHDATSFPAEETPVPEVKKAKSMDRDVALADIEKDKKSSFIKAWEETEKSKAENKEHKQLSAITAWENSKRADIEAKLKQIEEKYDKKKAEYAEKMKNKTGLIHKQAEEKRANVAAKKSEDDLKAEELAAKHRATGTVPKKLIACFGG